MGTARYLSSQVTSQFDLHLNENENSQNIPLIGEAGVVEVERLQSQQNKIIHGKCMLRCRTIPLIEEAGALRSQQARQLYLDNQLKWILGLIRVLKWI